MMRLRPRIVRGSDVNAFDYAMARATSAASRDDWAEAQTQLHKARRVARG